MLRFKPQWKRIQEPDILPMNVLLKAADLQMDRDKFKPFSSWLFCILQIYTSRQRPREIGRKRGRDKKEKALSISTLERSLMFAGSPILALVQDDI